MPLKYYYDLMSQPSRAVYMFLKINKIDFVDCAVALRKGEHLQSEYEKITPFKKVPVIDDDGFVLPESVAILKYLAAKYKTPDHWYPSDLKKRARVDEYMAWQHLNLRMFGSMYFRTRLLGGKDVDQEKLNRWKKDLDNVLALVEKTFLNNSNFLNGANEITIADLLAVCELEQPIAVNYDFRDKYPILAAYMKRVRERLQPHYDDAHQFARKLQEGVIKGKL